MRMIERRVDSIKNNYSSKISVQIVKLSRYLESLGSNSFSVEFMSFDDGFEVSKTLIDGNAVDSSKPYRNGLNINNFLDGLNDLFFSEILNPVETQDKRQDYSFTLIKDPKTLEWNARHSYSEVIDVKKEVLKSFNYSELSSNIGYRSLISFMKRKGIEKITGTIDSPFEDVSTQFSVHLPDGEISDKYADKVYPIVACSGDSLAFFLHEYFNDYRISLMPDWHSTGISGGSIVIMKDGSMEINVDEVHPRLMSIIDAEMCDLKIPIKKSKDYGNTLGMII